MPYEYRCEACDAGSAARWDCREDADDELAEHRRAAHGGLAPAAGDRVHRVHAEARGDGVLPAGWPIAALVLLVLMLANWWGR